MYICVSREMIFLTYRYKEIAKKERSESLFAVVNSP